MIAYSKIFKQAFYLIRTHKFLWTLGLFLVFGQGLNVSYRTDQNQPIRWSAYLAWINTHLWMFILIAVATIIVAVVLLQLNFRGKAAIIVGTKNILDKQDTGFKKSFSKGKNYYFRLLLVWFYTGFVLMLTMAVLIAPIIYLSSINYTGRAAILTLFALIIFIPLAVIVSLINNLAPMFVVFFDLKIKQAISSSFDMIKKYWTGMLMFSVLLGLLTALAVMVLAIAAGIAVVILRVLFYHTVGIPVSIGLIAAGIAAAVMFLIVGSAIASYQQICWVLLFNDLVRPQKIEEEEVLPVPEII